MNLSDLKTGMVVTHRDGVEGIVVRNVYLSPNSSKDVIILQDGAVMPLSFYKADLTHSILANFCIDKVEAVVRDSDIAEVLFPTLTRYEDGSETPKEREVLWERIVPRKMTLEEVEKLLGFKIEIVKS